MHFVIRAFVKGEDESDVIKRFITYVFENHLREHPGEKIVMVFDMSEAGLRHLVRCTMHRSSLIDGFISMQDYDLTKFIISLAQNYYPGILGIRRDDPLNRDDRDLLSSLHAHLQDAVYTLG